MPISEAPTIRIAADPELLPLHLFEGTLQAFRAATASVGCVTTNLAIGPFTIQLQFAGTALVEKMSAALSHLERRAHARPDLTICIWDSQSTGYTPPKPAWTEHYALRGEVEGYNSSRFYTVYEHESRGITQYDAARDLAIVWVPEAGSIPYWVKGSPLRMVLYWWMGLHRHQLMHAAAVGNTNGAVLIAGKSGSGKSTTALACLSDGMLYAGDDYVVVNLDGCPRVSTLYNTAKLCANHLHAFPQFASLIDNPNRLDSEKALIFLRDDFASQLVQSFPVRAILVPRVTGLRDTRVQRAPRAKALAALAPTTMFAHSRGGEHDFKHVAAVVQKVPCYVLECGTDLQKIPAAIRRLLDSELGPAEVDG